VGRREEGGEEGAAGLLSRRTLPYFSVVAHQLLAHVLGLLPLPQRRLCCGWPFPFLSLFSFLFLVVRASSHPNQETTAACAECSFVTVHHQQEQHYRQQPQQRGRCWRRSRSRSRRNGRGRRIIGRERGMGRRSRARRRRRGWRKRERRQGGAEGGGGSGGRREGAPLVFCTIACLLGFLFLLPLVFSLLVLSLFVLCHSFLLSPPATLFCPRNREQRLILLFLSLPPTYPPSLLRS